MFSIRNVAALLLLVGLPTGVAVAADPPASPDTNQRSAPVAASLTRTVLITGANRGIGFEFAKQYAAKGWTVIATARKPDEAFELNKLADEKQNIEIEQLDVTDVASVDALAQRLAGRPIDVLVNNAGNFGDPAKIQLGQVAFDEFDMYYQTNAMGSLKVTEALLTNLRAGQLKKVVAVTSLAGSFAYNTNPQTPKLPGHYFYKGAKAALNMMFLTLANDTRKEGLIVALVSPGQVDTRNYGMKGPGIVEIDKSIGGMIAVIDKLAPADSGTIWSWNGSPAAF
jgi:NAD(P)-dependent dehydrogenase (short-subunit alcohol dehydrogenase family)